YTVSSNESVELPVPEPVGIFLYGGNEASDNDLDDHLTKIQKVLEQRGIRVRSCGIDALPHSIEHFELHQLVSLTISFMLHVDSFATIICRTIIRPIRLPTGPEQPK